MPAQLDAHGAASNRSEKGELEVYRCAHLMLCYLDPNAFLRERLEALEYDPAGTATWRWITAASDLLRADTPAMGQRVQ